jgi:hypothetical protein
MSTANDPARVAAEKIALEEWWANVPEDVPGRDRHLFDAEVERNATIIRAAYAEWDREIAEAMKAMHDAVSLPTSGDYGDYQHATHTYEQSYGGGECSKHGRYYGSCASCRFDWQCFTDAKDREARYRRDVAINDASVKARAALALLGGTQ